MRVFLEDGEEVSRFRPRDARLLSAAGLEGDGEILRLVVVVRKRLGVDMSKAARCGAWESRKRQDEHIGRSHKGRIDMKFIVWKSVG